MKVTFAGYQSISILHGGPNTQLRQTAKHLASFGVETALFDSWQPFAKSSAELVHIFAANIGTYHLAREIHALGIPLVVSPIIYSTHSPGVMRAMLGVTRMARRAWPGLWSDYGLCADICQWAGRVVPNTESEAALVSGGLGIAPGKIRVIPNGVDERFAHGDPSLFEKKYGVRDFILNVGHIGHGRKNVLKLIEALGAIDHPAVVIGRFISGSYGEACRAEAAKHKQILLIDGLDNGSEMLASAYAAANTFVLPSIYETPGIAALEAGLAGAKIVITPYGGTKEYFGLMAGYVDPRSVASIRAGVIEALGRPKSPDLREHIARHFLWSRIAEKTAAVYHELIG